MAEPHRTGWLFAGVVGLVAGAMSMAVGVGQIFGVSF